MYPFVHGAPSQRVNNCMRQYAIASWEVSTRGNFHVKGVRSWNKIPNLEVTDRYQSTNSNIKYSLRFHLHHLLATASKLLTGSATAQVMVRNSSHSTTFCMEDKRNHPIFLVLFSDTVSFWPWTKFLPYQCKGKCPTEHKPRAFYCDTASVSLEQQRRDGAAITVHSQHTALSIH